MNLYGHKGDHLKFDVILISPFFLLSAGKIGKIIEIFSHY